MTAVDVRRMHLRYSGAVGGRRARLDRVARRELADRLDIAVGDALAACGIGDEELVLVRRLEVPVVLDLDQGDVSLGRAWADAIATALRRAVAGGDVVRYRTVAHALADVVAAAPRGDLRRAWAWAALDLWPVIGDEPVVDVAAGLTHALATEPRIAPAVVADLARRPVPWSALVAALDDDGWIAVARAAVRAAEGHPALVDTALRRTEAAPPSRTARGAAPGPGPTELAGPPPHARPHAAVAIAIALVLAAARDPGSLRGSEARALATVEGVLRSGPHGRESGRGAPEGARVVPDEGHLLAPGELAGETDPDHDALGDAGVATDLGGLPFLLNVVAGLAVVADADRLPANGLRWLLHRAAVVLTGGSPDDAGVLAFAGLGPDADPPDGPDGTEDAVALARILAERVAALIGDELGDDPVAAVCRRPATVVADPGWIEVRLPLNGVDLAVRRSGLDRDPGWLPWLGCVVRFRYA